MKLATFAKAVVLSLPLACLPLTNAVMAQELASAAPASSLSQPVNINTADAVSLAGSLSGIGISKAEAIVAYRKQHGPFKSVDELANVKGIGQKTLERLRPRVAI